MAAVLALAAMMVGSAAQGCLDVRGSHAPVALEGRLERHIYPGLPNYESIQRGDAPEPAYILVLRHPICIDDGARGEPFSRVHLFSSNDRLEARLRAAIGHRIRIRGSGFGSFTMHNRAPLVVNVTMIVRTLR